MGKSKKMGGGSEKTFMSLPSPFGPRSNSNYRVCPGEGPTGKSQQKGSL